MILEKNWKPLYISTPEGRKAVLVELVVNGYEVRISKKKDQNKNRTVVFLEYRDNTGMGGDA